jgi:curved DNA-binding protein
MEYTDYYSILGVPRTATQAEIKKAYRKLARQHHPDVNKGTSAAEKRFKEINEANAVLGDSQKRRAYDQLGSNYATYQQAAGAGMSFEEFVRHAQAGGAQAGGAQAGGAQAGGGFPGGAGFGGAGFPGGIRFEYRGNTEDLGGFSDFFRAFFGGGTGSPAAGEAGSPVGGRRSSRGTGRRGRSPAPDHDLWSPEAAGAVRPGDIEVETDVSLEEVALGSTRLVRVGDRRLEVKIPPGVADGQRIRLSGKAGSGDAAGDLYVRTKVAPHPVFERKEADLSREISITLREALLGGEIPVETVTGNRLLLTVPSGTQNGRVFRLAGQGLPRFRAEGRGDLRVRVRIVLPGPLGPRQRELADQFLDAVAQPDPRVDGEHRA